MGSRDKGHKETKKPKKDTKKATLTNILTPPPPVVEVIKRGKKEPREDED
jgi:hypothetical protein